MNKAGHEQDPEGIKLALNLVIEYRASDSAHGAAVGTASGGMTFWRLSGRT